MPRPENLKFQKSIGQGWGPPFRPKTGAPALANWAPEPAEADPAVEA